MTRAERRRFFRSIVEGVMVRPGHLGPDLRRAAVDGTPLPSPLDAFAAKVRADAAAVTDEDIAVLHAAGHTDDQIFELTVATALGASAERLGVALRALGRED